jgi:hypothetical protein
LKLKTTEEPNFALDRPIGYKADSCDDGVFQEHLEHSVEFDKSKLDYK